MVGHEAVVGGGVETGELPLLRAQSPEELGVRELDGGGREAAGRAGRLLRPPALLDLPHAPKHLPQGDQGERPLLPPDLQPRPEDSLHLQGQPGGGGQGGALHRQGGEDPPCRDSLPGLAAGSGLPQEAGHRVYVGDTGGRAATEYLAIMRMRRMRRMRISYLRSQPGQHSLIPPQGAGARGLGGGASFDGGGASCHGGGASCQGGGALLYLLLPTQGLQLAQLGHAG